MSPKSRRPSEPMAEPRPGGAALRSIGDVLSQSPRLKRPDVLSWWEWLDVVGARVAARSSPERIEQATLWVAVEGSAWAAELSLLAPMILQRLAQRRIKLQALRFRVGPVRVPQRPAPVALPKPAELAPDLAARLALLDHDPELKATLTEAIRLCAARQSAAEDRARR